MLQASISVPETSSNVGTGTDFRSIDIPSFVQTALETCQLKVKLLLFPEVLIIPKDYGELFWEWLVFFDVMLCGKDAVEINCIEALDVHR